MGGEDQTAGAPQSDPRSGGKGEGHAEPPEKLPDPRPAAPAASPGGRVGETSHPPGGGQSSVRLRQPPRKYSGPTGPSSAQPQQRGLKVGGLGKGVEISEPQSWPETWDQLPQPHIQLLAGSDRQMAPFQAGFPATGH